MNDNDLTNIDINPLNTDKCPEGCITIVEKIEINMNDND